MKQGTHIMSLIAAAALTMCGPALAQAPAWPPAPAAARVRFVREIKLPELSQHRSLLGRIGRVLGGGEDGERLGRPVSLLIHEDRLYVTCQGREKLAVIDLDGNSFRWLSCKGRPLASPIDLVWFAGTLCLSDSGNGTVYRLRGNDLEPWLTTGLRRPTGLAVTSGAAQLLVVDTGDHNLKFFADDGQLVRTIGGRGETGSDLNFPTFAATIPGGFLVNDTLNYLVKRFDDAGSLQGSFGGEGDGPGFFARAKDLAVDPDGNAWVVDALFDNIQIFDPAGRLLLVIGGPGQDAGEFWSPTGITFAGSEAYIADTYNNRIQVLQYLGGDS